MNTANFEVSLFLAPENGNIENFSFAGSPEHIYPDNDKTNFSFALYPSLDFKFSDGIYEPPLYAYTDVSFIGDVPYLPPGTYKPPIYKFTNFKFDGKYKEPTGDKTDFEFWYKPECPPDWTITPPLAAVINFEPCEIVPDGLPTDPSAAIINFGCCKEECEPDFKEQNGGSVIIDIDSCTGEPDFREQPGGAVIIDINCCSEEPPLEPVFASGSLLFDFGFTGEAIHDLAFTASGDLKFDQVILSGAADIGARIIGDLKFGQIIVSGEALVASDEYRLIGDLQLPMRVAGVAEHHEPRDAYGDIQFPMIVNGQATLVPIAEGDIILEMPVEGIADYQEVEVLASNLKFEEIIVNGEATYNIVPTGSGKLVLSMPLQGEALYVDLPTAWGDIPFEVTIQSDGETEAGAHVYWADLRLKMPITGEAITPIHVEESDIVLDMSVQGDVIAAAVVMDSNIDLGKIVFNRGYAEFGDPLPPVIREIYEASNVRSHAIPEYPVEAKYPIYVPTTDYNITEVQLRRGTLDYTIEFNFDAMHVEKINVWIVDENGNATIDTVAKWLNGAVENHVLNRPFKYVLSIPVHCVNDKRYEFMLEVVYDEGDHGNTVTRPRKSFFVPFQAHFDNRNPFINSTDRATSLDANYGSNTMFETEFTDFAPNTYTFEESGNVHLSNAASMDTLKTDFFELTMIEWRVQESQNVGFGVNHNEFGHKYYELDVGQIGG